MECSECGARCKERSAICPECGAKQVPVPAEPALPPEPDLPSLTVKAVATVPPLPESEIRPTPSLLEFPGLNRRSIPEWRKEVSDRVREAQERRARENELDASEISDSAGEKKAAPLLELLPQSEAEPMNPIVVAALRRLEKAQVPSHLSGNTAVAYAYEEQPDPGPHTMVEETVFASQLESESPSDSALLTPEKAHNLAVVPTPTLEPEPAEELIVEPRVEFVRPKPKRLIREDHDPALNYLDSVNTTVVVDTSLFRSASMSLRIVAGLVDLVFVTSVAVTPILLVASPNLGWSDLRLSGSIAASIVGVGFLYLTISTALTGRTLGMRLFSLRAVDVRTGLIPTGKQSAGRSIVYLLSLASAGLLFIYALLNPDRKTLHDRASGTTVVQA